MKTNVLKILLLVTLNSYSQEKDSISIERIRNYIGVLASDSLKGRGNYLQGMHDAAAFIEGHFRTRGLSSFPGRPGLIQNFSFDGSHVFPVSDSAPKSLLNVIGVLEGKKYRDEVVIISAHYDHIGFSKIEKDKIYNGANDNASGTAAVMELAHYFSMREDNERTILFCAFGGEELGLLGSKLFSTFLKPEKIIAVINIEMIGIPQNGQYRFFITGDNYKDLPKHTDATLKNTIYKRVKEPDPDKQLFYRSDNLPFAEKTFLHILL